MVYLIFQGVAQQNLRKISLLMPQILLLPKELANLKSHIKNVYYSQKYMDDLYLYRTVTIVWSSVPTIRFRNKVCQGEEWREGLGITMSPGWVHLGWSPCELSQATDAMIFRKDIDKDPKRSVYKRAQENGVILPKDAINDDLL